MLCGFCVLDSNYIDPCIVTLTTLKRNYDGDFKVFYRAGMDVSKLKFLGFPLIPISFQKFPCICWRYNLISDLLLAKLAIFSELSKHYKGVFNLDLDLHIRKPLNFDLKEPGWYGCLETLSKGRYINFGFTILYNKQIDFLISDFFKFIQDNQVDCPEQDYINFRFKDIIRVLPSSVSWNHNLPFEDDPIMVHHLGDYKPYTLIPDSLKCNKEFMYYKREYIKTALEIPELTESFRAVMKTNM